MNAIIAAWSKLDPRDRKALSLLSVFLLLAAGYLGVFEPLSDMYEADAQKQTDLQQTIAEDTPKALVLSNRESRLRQARDEYNTLTSRLELRDLKSWAESDVYNDIRDYARITRVAVKDIRPMAPRKDGFMNRMPFSVTFQGDFSSIEEFIYYLETSPQVFVITQLSLSGKSGQVEGEATLEKYSLPAGGKVEPPKQPVEVVLTVPRWLGFAPFEYARSKGWLSDKKGERVDLFFSEYEKTNLRMLYAGEVDGTATQVFNLVRELIHGANLKILAPLAYFQLSDSLLTSIDSKITSVEDLRGKTVYLEKGSVSHFFLYKVLKQHGMSLSDVTVRNMNRPMVAQSLEAGLIEAGVTFEPFVSRLVKIKAANVLVAPDSERDKILQILIFREDSLAGHEHTIESLIRSYYQAVDWWKAHPQESVEFVAGHDGEGASAATIRDILQGVRYLSSEEVRSLVCPGPGGKLRTEDFFREYEDFFRQYLGYELVVPQSEVIDWRFAQKVFHCSEYVNSTAKPRQ
jgi:NitT/TauT family transport system substrate-binding protein